MQSALRMTTLPFQDMTVYVLCTHISMIMDNLTPSFLCKIWHTFHSDF